MGAGNAVVEAGARHPVDDAPWFDARDFARLIGRKKVEGLLDDDQRARVILRQGDSCESVEVIIKSATFAIYYRYRNPENHHLRRWLSREVIPSLRGQMATASLKPRRVLIAWDQQRVSLLKWQGELWAPLEQMPRFST